MKMLKCRTTPSSELDTVIGRLGNIGFIICQIFHFLSRLQELFRRAKNRRSIKIDDTVAKDLELMIYFLDKAKEGVDINLIAYRKPTQA